MVTLLERSTSFANDELRWAAVARRAPEADGAFLYAVKTTGVYCRPACPSRRPNRGNVVYFPTPVDAERAGFRACRKCRPGAADDGPTRRARPVLRACQIIEAADTPPALAELAEAVGLSPFYFHRLFKQVTGVTPKGYAAARRAERLRQGLAAGKPVTAAIYGAGFGSAGRCYASTGDLLGMPPSAYRGGAAGVHVGYVTAPCALGWVLVAATDRGVCAIELDDTPARLRARLAARFPKAVLTAAGPDFADRLRRVVAFIEAPTVRGLDLPLDIRGTAFQHQVWTALRSIPPGQTATYVELAARLGRPSAARAVARACASNPLAVAIPCHRAVGSDGSLTGYRWGVGRKRALLEREQAQTKTKRGNG